MQNLKSFFSVVQVGLKLFDLNPTIEQLDEWWQLVTNGDENGEDTLLLNMEQYIQICMSKNVFAIFSKPIREFSALQVQIGGF